MPPHTELLGGKTHPRAYSRRDFFNLAALVAGGGVDWWVSHKLGLETPLTPVWERLETNDLLRQSQKEIETKFSVRIYNPDVFEALRSTRENEARIQQELGEKVSVTLKIKDPFVQFSSWDSPRLALLHRVLMLLPESFYTSPRGKVTFALLSGSDMSRRRDGEAHEYRGLCVCTRDLTVWDVDRLRYDESPPVMLFVKKDLRGFRDEQDHSEELFVHEMCHIRVEKEREIDDINTNHLIQEALTALGIRIHRSIDLDQPQPELIELLKNGKHFIMQHDGEIQYIESDRLGMAIRPNELISIGSESYFHGFGRFQRMWEPDLGPEKTIKWFLFLKHKVFDGMEYGC